MLDLLLFTVEGREHLFQKTVQKLDRIGERELFRIIVVVDGSVDINVIRAAKPDLIMQSGRRRGYIGSITDALPLVRSEFFVWVEDDWDLGGIHPGDLSLLLSALRADASLLQIKWSRTAPLDGLTAIDGKVLASPHGFSAQPNVSRTTQVREGFDFLLRDARRSNRLGKDGFEDVLTAWAEARSFRCGVLDPGNLPAISSDFLESTGRMWHTTGALAKIPKGHGYLGDQAPFWRRMQMLSKLALAFAKLSFLQLFKPEYYELAFRICHLPLLRGAKSARLFDN